MKTYPKLPKAFKKKWLTALRSGKYKQGRSSLKMKDENKYCCLGIACLVAGQKNIGSDGFISMHNNLVPKILKSSDYVPYELANMNDSGHSFTKIANWIEKHL